MKPPKLSKPSFATYKSSNFPDGVEAHKDIQARYAQLTMQWAALEFFTSASLIHSMGLYNLDIADIVIGRMDISDKFTKLIKVCNKRGMNREALQKLNEFKDGLEAPRDIRNKISHLPIIKFDPKDKDCFYLKPLHGTLNFKEKFDAYKMRLSELKLAAEYVSYVSTEIHPFVSSNLPSKSSELVLGRNTSHPSIDLNHKKPKPSDPPQS